MWRDSVPEGVRVEESHKQAVEDIATAVLDNSSISILDAGKEIRRRMGNMGFNPNEIDVFIVLGESSVSVRWWEILPTEEGMEYGKRQVCLVRVWPTEA